MHPPFLKKKEMCIRDRFTILLMIELLDLPKDSRYKKMLNLGSVAFFTLYFIYRLNGVGLLPYQFFWMNGGM